ncbi:hypothetical protein LD119_00330 [Mesoplasma sp. JKS002660]|uniref:PD-(D/E)XK motif protein n=1 Tax=Mesoplasma whartonense TaxID=2878854 RepID=UPI002022A865|nr:PD-(D/E)XK motif protein [Mesoplasma sp. JKS002660]MCL8213402.1 hypothetical protein [Mesoplasma sp. JKS002660]
MINFFEIEKGENKGFYLINKDSANNKAKALKNSFYEYINDGVIVYDNCHYEGEILKIDTQFTNSDLAEAIKNFIVELCNENKTLYDAVIAANKFFKIRDLFSPRMIQGLFAEFLLIYKLKKLDLDITPNFHEDSFAKNDFYFDDYSIEVKSTTKKDRQYHVSYDQIVDSKQMKFLVCVQLEKANNGNNVFNRESLTLPELVNKILLLFDNDIHSDILMDVFKFIIETEKNSPNLKTIRFVFDPTDDVFTIYEREIVPMLSSNNEERISSIRYLLNLADLLSITIKEFVDLYDK